MKTRALTFFGIFLFIAIEQNALAQLQIARKAVLMDINTSMESGWWIYNKGTDQDSSFQLGWDRTDNENTISLGLDLWYKTGRWQLGGGASFSAFFDDKMEAFEDQVNGRKRYPISNGAVTFVKYYLQLEYSIYQGRKYDFNLHGRFGGFAISTTHPEKDNFKRRTFYEVGISNQIHLKHIIFVIRPKYANMTIHPKKEKNPGEIHNIRSYGISFGVRFPLGKRTGNEGRS